MSANTAERGISVAPGSAFVGAGHAPNAVRVALASPSHRLPAESLEASLERPFRFGVD